MVFFNSTFSVDSIARDIINSNLSHITGSQDILSQSDMGYIYTINLAIICGLISVTGIITNSINIAVFLRQGFRETINISLFSLAISDLISLVLLLLISICYNPYFMYSDLPVLTVELQHVSCAWTHIIFVRITGLITVFITFERCLCITFPLKVKNILNPKRVKNIIIAIYVFVILNLAPLYFSFYIGWRFIPELNRSMIGNVYNQYRPPLKRYVFGVQPFYVVGSFLSVVICSYILISKLNERSKWRQTASTGINEQKSMVRDGQIVKMVIYLAIIFIISYTPSLLLFIIMLVIPEDFTIGQKFENSFVLTYSTSFAFGGVNSSVNIFVYYFTSTNYRYHFKSLFFKHRKTDTGD